MRLDKWIWAVRIVKSRTLAIEFCKLGRVTVNGIIAKPAKEIRVADVIEVATKSGLKIYKVVGFIAKPLSLEKVTDFFEDLTPAEPQKCTKNLSQNLDPVRRQEKRKYRKDQGRPVKKERRDLDLIREDW